MVDWPALLRPVMRKHGRGRVHQFLPAEQQTGLLPRPDPRFDPRQQAGRARRGPVTRARRPKPAAGAVRALPAGPDQHFTRRPRPKAEAGPEQVKPAIPVETRRESRLQEKGDRDDRNRKADQSEAQVRRRRPAFSLPWRARRGAACGGRGGNRQGIGSSAEFGEGFQMNTGWPGAFAQCRQQIGDYHPVRGVRRTPARWPDPAASAAGRRWHEAMFASQYPGAGHASRPAWQARVRQSPRPQTEARSVGRSRPIMTRRNCACRASRANIQRADQVAEVIVALGRHQSDPNGLRRSQVRLIAGQGEAPGPMAIPTPAVKASRPTSGRRNLRDMCGFLQRMAAGQVLRQFMAK